MEDHTDENGQRHAFTTDATRWKKYLKAYSRQNRRQPTEAEDMLWQVLRNGASGFRFRRQHAIDQYIVDFVCLKAWLVIEVDGDVHAEPGQAEYDQGRTYTLRELGFRVVRFKNEDVLHNTQHVLAIMQNYLPSL